ncbi:MAG: class I SAM-dependent methyltransferase [Acidimicrobiales bacterium]
MSFYGDKVLPRLQDKAMNRQGIREVRARVCAGLTGKVLEIGFGTGLNVRYYPPEVTTVLAVEPSRACMRLAAPRISSSNTVVEHAGLTGEHLDLPSEEIDVALSTWTLCTIPDLSAALGEVRRVLKPGGTFHFVEHGHAPDAKTARWQHRLDPLNQRLAGGCHLTRRISESVEQAGFELEHLDRYYCEGEPKPWGYTYEGRAVKI